MPNIFFISDTHFGHANSLVFPAANGEGLMRGDDFADVEEMDEYMVEKWNSVVRDCDTIYHLGDVAINKRYLEVVKRLRGRKILIKGNHDIFGMEDYVDGAGMFKDIRAYKVFPKHKVICSHIPLHPDSLGRFGLNIHGHLHDRVVGGSDGIGGEDYRYFNVSVEQVGYTPISLDEVLLANKERIERWEG